MAAFDKIYIFIYFIWAASKDWGNGSGSLELLFQPCLVSAFLCPVSPIPISLAIFCTLLVTSSWCGGHSLLGQCPKGEDYQWEQNTVQPSLHSCWDRAAPLLSMCFVKTLQAQSCVHFGAPEGWGITRDRYLASQAHLVYSKIILSGLIWSSCIMIKCSTWLMWILIAS